MNCYYCDPKWTRPAVDIDCEGNPCCVECWEEMDKWTLRKSLESRRLQKEVSAILTHWFEVEVPKTKTELVIPLDRNCIICRGCRKPVKSDEEGNLYCECHDERTGKHNPETTVPIPSRFLKGIEQEKK